MAEQLTVFGANGRVGRRVAAEALARGYSVVAFVHSRSQLATHDNLRIVQGDIYNPADVARALEGSTAVVSALGSWSTAAKDILTAGMTTIIPAMRRSGVATIISLTGADARSPGDKRSIIHNLMHAFLMVIAPKIMVDGEQHITLLADSSLDWTVLRSPIMKPKAGAGRYALSDTRPLPWQLISYDTVALAMVNALQDRTWSKAAPYVTKR